MLNKKSRSYFQRAFAASGTTFNSFALSDVSHTQILQECSKITEMDKLMEYLRTENSSTLISCPLIDAAADVFNPVWAPVVESNNTKNAFLTKTPKEIYNNPSGEAPVMDAMFSFTAQVSRNPVIFTLCQKVKINFSFHLVIVGGIVDIVQHKFIRKFRSIDQRECDENYEIQTSIQGFNQNRPPESMCVFFQHHFQNDRCFDIFFSLLGI